MASQEWTLEGELERLAAVDHWPTALVQLGVMSSDQQPFQLAVRRDWYPAGAETYVYEFEVIGTDHRRHLLLKACVAMGPLSPVGRIADLWLHRRQLLETNGVRTPRHYALHAATFLEEYIPHGLWDQARSSGDTSDNYWLWAGLGSLAFALDELHFRPLSLHDLRTHGNDVVMVDFGQDLGDPTDDSDILVNNLGLVINDSKRMLARSLTPIELQAIAVGYEKPTTWRI